MCVTGKLYTEMFYNLQLLFLFEQKYWSNLCSLSLIIYVYVFVFAEEDQSRRAKTQDENEHSEPVSW